ncbi:hypothetical protein QNO07_03495 [Streptomyces sp. 549]|uniref:hypothetical protein n=1 Tax=Streptomyces sp. 549 TaxID=3049076 RepID=UPI0024C25E27|nr:hypothetical protein [Streptomyces sp. 549]MDK1472498.1 hypothetical protein [Streptomyces sp. 549]
MTTASLTPAVGGRSRGATAIGPADAHTRHLLGNSLRAVRVFFGAAIDIAVLGRMDDGTAAAAGIHRRH